MREVETVGIVVGNRLLEEGLHLCLGRLAGGSVLALEGLVDGEEHVLELEFFVLGVNGYVRESCNAAVRIENRTVTVAQGLCDGRIGARERKEFIKSVLSADGQDFAEICFHIVEYFIYFYMQFLNRGIVFYNYIRLRLVGFFLGGQPAGCLGVPGKPLFQRGSHQPDFVPEAVEDGFFQRYGRFEKNRRPCLSGLPRQKVLQHLRVDHRFQGLPFGGIFKNDRNLRERHAYGFFHPAF